jgi:glyoxylase-like metal-dependent hydrolase (beta-lactamase superfamily II)
MERRRFILTACAVGAAATAPAWSALAGAAEQAHDFIMGPPVPDRAPTRLSTRVWMILAPDGFPTLENRGLMANVVFAIGPTGVVVIDSGCSLQIGEMALRMIRRLTPQPVVAVFNSHYHGDHWLGNHAFAQAYGPSLPIYALAHTQKMIQGHEGRLWKGLMERWTNQSTLGTEVVAPNRVVAHGQSLNLGGLTFKMHHYGTAHTPSDLSVQIVEEGLTCVGDVAMGNRIANMDDGSYAGTLAYYERLQQATGAQLWVPGHGAASTDLLQRYGSFLRGIWENCLAAVKAQESEAQAKARVLADPRVSSRARSMQGFANNIGKYVSLAYLEAERDAF